MYSALVNTENEALETPGKSHKDIINSSF